MQARSPRRSILHHMTRLGHILLAYELYSLHTNTVDSRLE